MNFKIFSLFAVLTAFGSSHLRAENASLPQLNINLQETSVSGLSSGGYMAVQFHVANSAMIKGAGVIAGGPYFCAQNDLTTATSACSCVGAFCQPGQVAQSVPELVQTTDQNANQGAIDPTSNLSNSRIWLFSGRSDTRVPPPVMNALETYYKHYVTAANIFYKKNILAEHAMPTDSFGNACNFRGDPFINNCNFDAAGELLKWIYGNLNPRNSEALSGHFIEFDQAEFLPNPTAHGMSQTGWAYVPASCQQNAPCKVHVAFHGCRQYPDYPYAAGPNGKFGDTYVENAGYNRWADTNNMVILYPQANKIAGSNPLGCWDWWGYDDGAYAKKSGRQMAAVKGMLTRLAGGPSGPPAESHAFCGSATNSAHAAANRAYSWFSWWYFARGSNDFLGSGETPTTLHETSTGSFKKETLCS